MTTIVSGQINTGVNTPTGAKAMVAVDNPYLDKETFMATYEAAGLGLTVNDAAYTSGELDRKLLQASAAVNRFCRRWFDTQTVDEQKTSFTVRPYNPQLVTVVLRNRPYSKINSIYIQVLKWFIQVDVSASTGYLQDFYQDGFYKIVPVLSSAGTGVGSPIPAAILDRVPLGVLWTNYTFGYGTPLTAQTLTKTGQTTEYQAPLGNRLWAPSQTVNVYDAAVLVAPAGYTIDYPNGKVTFGSHTPTGAITADFTTNDSVPFDIKEATLLLACHLIGQAAQNPLGAASMGIQTFNINFGNNSKLEDRFKALLEPYVDRMPALLGI